MESVEVGVELTEAKNETELDHSFEVIDISEISEEGAIPENNQDLKSSKNGRKTSTRKPKKTDLVRTTAEEVGERSCQETTQLSISSPEDTVLPSNGSRAERKTSDTEMASESLQIESPPNSEKDSEPSGSNSAAASEVSEENSEDASIKSGRVKDLIREIEERNCLKHGCRKPRKVSVSKSFPTLRPDNTNGFPNFEERPKTAPNDLSEPANNESSRISTYSDYTDYGPSDSDQESISKPGESDVDSVATVETATTESTTHPKTYLIARELVTSEKVFIDTIRLLNVLFRDRVQQENHKSKSKIIPNSELESILKQLPELMLLNEDLYSDMKQRLDNWSENPKISDIIAKKGAFLKMYAQYAQNFEAQTKALEDCCVKYPKFAKLVKEFEADKCNKLQLQHHMLKPVQRIPQYRLLLDDYLKHLDVTSPDYEDTLTALRVVTEVAEHLNNSIKHGDKVSRMVQLQTMLGDFELVKPGRELVKDGPLAKVCRKTAKDRYFILLNDCLLYSTPYKNVLKLHQTLPLGGMKIKNKEDDLFQHTFAVVSTTKSFMLSAKSDAEKKEWVDALTSAITDYNARKMSFSVNSFMNVSVDNFKLGKEAPVWIPDGKVTMCQICAADFTQLHRRHHCRACGKVVCGSCSDNTAPLEYKKFKPQRVCSQCLDQLLAEFEENEEIIKKGLPGESEEAVQSAYWTLKSKFVRSQVPETSKTKKSVPNRLAEVAANDPDAEMKGWLRTWKSHRWKMYKRWYVLKDRILYVYGGSQDVVATKSTPILGYAVERGAKENLDGMSNDLIFQLTHSTQPPTIFAADTPEMAERWFEFFSQAADVNTFQSLNS